MLKWISCIVFWGLLQSVHGQSNNSSLLWEIRGNGLKSPSYIFGTFHILCPTDFSVSPTLSQTLKQTKQLYLEIDLSKPSVQLELMSMMRLNGTSLDKEIGDDFDGISSKFKDITGTPLAAFKQFKPFMGLSLLTLATVPCKEKIQPETLLMTLAKEANMGIGGLETVADQVNAINAQPISEQIVDLKKMVNNFDSVKTQMQSLLRVYKLNHLDSIQHFMQSQQMTAQFEQDLLINRNKNWIPRIVEAANQSASFFAVGAAHLVGPQGVIALLKQKGYQLRPIKY